MHTERPPKDKPTLIAARWLKYLIAIVIGNGIYFTLSPYLPPAARHEAFQVDLGTIIDFWFCLVVYGVFELAAFVRSRRK